MKNVVLITGSSRGIGAATARLLAARGAAVCLNHASADGDAAALAREIRDAGGEAIDVRADVSDPDAVQALFETIDGRLGRLTGLVNNAGVTGRAANIAQLDPTSVRRVLEVNVLGPLLCTQAAVQRMALGRGGGGGAIVNVSSISAQTGGAGMLVPYASSKAAVNAMTVGLARELAHEGIRVNAVMPGIIETTIHDKAGVGDRMPALLTQVPMRRMGSPEECGEAIYWLMSAAAAYVTGVVLPVTGGR